TPIPIVDSEYRLVALLAGQPAGENWMTEVHDPLLAEMTEEREGIEFTDKEINHRRGKHAVLLGGISFGGGAERPGNLDTMRVPLTKAFERLIELPAMKRLAGYIDRKRLRNSP
ncbi:hypothetical protein C8J56DRAFT_760008, partial [Mycena floridula]